jgi:hypothetical protein
MVQMIMIILTTSSSTSSSGEKETKDRKEMRTWKSDSLPSSGANLFLMFVVVLQAIVSREEFVRLLLLLPVDRLRLLRLRLLYEPTESNNLDFISQSRSHVREYTAEAFSHPPHQALSLLTRRRRLIRKERDIIMKLNELQSLSFPAF